jgi:hypothetical protein
LGLIALNAETGKPAQRARIVLKKVTVTMAPRIAKGK